MKWKIGNVEIANQVCLAPMASICNSAYRQIIKEQGCGLIFAEMVSDKALMYENEKTKQMLFMTEYERPIVQQIFGSDVESFVIAAKKVYEVMKPDIIDINMGCPVPKVAIKSQAGSALLKNPKKVSEIVSAVVQSVPCPVTVKIRSGWDSNSINAVQIAKICEAAGASAITVHPRTRSQGYSGKADWNVIKEVKANIAIPVIGNGDIITKEDAKRMLQETGCDAIMIGRGVLGNPWLISQALNYIDKGVSLPSPNPQERIAMALKHFNLMLKHMPERQAILEARGHIAWYLKGITNSHEIKEQIFTSKTKEEITFILNKFLTTL